MDADLDLPLSDDELDELDDFLLSDAVGDDAMDVSMLDGFLTALAIGPNTLPPSRWMPLIWGEGMTWDSPARAKRMMSMVLRHANATLFVLRSHPAEFEPLLLLRDEEGREIPVIDDWCTGFVTAMSLDEAAWQPMMASAEGSKLLHPMMLFGTEDGCRQREEDPSLDDGREQIAALLGGNVIAIMDWWLPIRKANSTVRRALPKVGRNEACPCGSGRKFKHCCERRGTLH